MYCYECKNVFTGEVCPYCGCMDVRMPEPHDDCFLVETEMLIGELLAETLRQERIPFYFKTRYGAGITARIGAYCEHYLFFVPYSHLALARQHAEIICPSS